jgi:hypothetical protein
MAVQAVRCTGFSLVVVADDGTLLACGHGTPPSWIFDSAGAEAWAFYVALDMCPFPPPITTDCLGLLESLERGKADATAANRPLARLWRMIFGALDGYPEPLHRTGMFIWMPAHRSAGAVGSLLRSDGQPITMVDWRANRLADILAKAAALKYRMPLRALKLLRDAAAAMEYAGALLGTVTYAANHYCDEVRHPDGTVSKCRRRDAMTARRPCAAVPRSAAAPTQTRSGAAEMLGAPVVYHGSLATGRVRSQSHGLWRPAQRRAASHRSSSEQRQFQHDARFLESWRSRLQLAPDTSVPGGAAALMEALRLRVCARAHV